MQKREKYKKQYKKDQQTVKSSDKLNRKILQNNVIDKNKFESLCNILLNTWMERKMNLFYEN